MSTRLSLEDLARMRARHVDDGDGFCVACSDDSSECWLPLVSCDARRLLAHFAPGPVPHLAGIQVGLMGPVSSEELAR